MEPPPIVNGRREGAQTKLLGSNAFKRPLGPSDNTTSPCMLPDPNLVAKCRAWPVADRRQHIYFDQGGIPKALRNSGQHDNHGYVFVQVGRRSRNAPLWEHAQWGWITERAHRIVLFAHYGPARRGRGLGKKAVAMHVSGNASCLNPGV
jgi:hypothetical protein